MLLDTKVEQLYTSSSSDYSCRGEEKTERKGRYYYFLLSWEGSVYSGKPGKSGQINRLSLSTKNKIPYNMRAVWCCWMRVYRYILWYIGSSSAVRWMYQKNVEWHDWSAAAGNHLTIKIRAEWCWGNSLIFLIKFCFSFIFKLYSRMSNHSALNPLSYRFSEAIVPGLDYSYMRRRLRWLMKNLGERTE